MSRLTEKNVRYCEKENAEMHKDYLTHIYDFYEKVGKIENKLSQLEDLEEELGCPLDVVFKALKNGFYDEHGNWYKVETNDFNLKYDWLLSNPNDKYLIFDVEDTYLDFKLRDYQKTWWLKEDRSE